MVLCAAGLLLPAAGAPAAPREGAAPRGKPQADLAVLLVTATPSPVAPFAPLTYTITVTNHGPDASPDTVVSALVDMAQFISGPPTCLANGNFVPCALGTLDAGATASVTLEFVTVSAPVVHNNAHVQGALPDPAPDNNLVVLTTPIVSPAPRSELAHGVELTGTLLAAEGAAGDTYRLRQQRFSSYEIVVDATSGDIGDANGVRLVRMQPDETELQTAEAVGSGPSRSLRFINAATSVIDGELIRVRAPIVLPPTGNADDVYQVRAFDTTYAVSRFNNGGSQKTVLLVQNPTSRAVRVVAFFWTEAGGLLATHEPEPLPAHGLMVLDTSTVSGLGGAAGSITIVNDAPYGALAGKAVSLEASTGFGFDTRMEPRVH